MGEIRQSLAMSRHVPTSSITLRAPAKLNLVLRVGPPGEDGYHRLASWMCTVGLFDTIELRGSRADVASVELDCDDRALPRDAGNLVVRAARALCDRAGVRARLRLQLRKRIPAAAGLGGGSSDAGSTLIGLSRLLGLDLGTEALMQVAGGIGADVPFFVGGAPSAWCEGRGEIIRPVAPPSRARTALLVLPRGIALSTAEVYRRFDEMGLGKEQNLRQLPDVAHLATLGSRQLLPLLVNDLEPAAFSLAPELAEMRTVAERAMGRPVRMSGSGSALFTLLDETDGAPGGGVDHPEPAEAVASVGKAIAPSAAQVLLVPVAPDGEKIDREESDR